MRDTETVIQKIAEKECKEELLFSDSNLYESIYIRARIYNGALTVIDSECGHAPDGGWSHRSILFDKENTERVVGILLDMSYDPYRGLKQLINYDSRLDHFIDICEQQGIKYESRWSF